MPKRWTLERGGTDCEAKDGTEPGETSSEVREAALLEWLTGVPTTDWTTGEVDWKGVYEPKTRIHM